MKGKKGVSQVVTYALMISLAVGLGAFVTYWYQSSAEKQTETVLVPFAGASECAQVNINVAFDFENCQLKVYNSGLLKFVEFEAYIVPEQTGLPNPITYEDEVLPKEWADPISLPDAEQGMKAEVFPIIELDGGLFKCQKNKVFEAKEAFTC